MEKATFAAGCFWGPDHKFSKVTGVTATAVGYMGGRTDEPTYEEVCTDETGHAEVVQLEFDPAQVSYQTLVRKFFDMHNPTQLNRQGPDEGSQYRTAIFCHSPQQKEVAEQVKAELNKSKFAGRIVTEVVPAQTFWRAEEYHQKYRRETPRPPLHLVSMPSARGPSSALTVLVLCTGNSARSIMAEALINHLGAGRFRAYSAGSRPAGTVNPLALRTLGERGIPAADARSKSWDEFARAGAPHMDIVVTVCDNAAGETCPLWPGTPVKVHWGLPDPAQVVGSEAERLHAFAEAYRMIEKRVQRLVALRDPMHENRQLEMELRRIHIEA